MAKKSAAPKRAKVQSITESELDDWVRGCADYLTGKGLRDRLMTRPSAKSLDGHPYKRLSFHDYEGFMTELRQVQADLNAAESRLQTLRRHFQLGEMVPFDEIEPRMDRAHEMVASALVEIADAVVETRARHLPGTKAMKLQEAAVKLADAAVGVTQPRRVREIAKRIMMEGRLEVPDDRTISHWIKTLKAGNGK